MTLAPPAPRPDLLADAVVGDGTTFAGRSRTRWQRVRWPLAVLLTFLTAGALASVLQARTSTTPFAPDNPNEYGSRALAQILEDQGVEVRYVRSVDDAVSLAVEDTTLLVTPQTWSLMFDDLLRLADVPADVVLVERDGSAIDAITEGAVSFTWEPGPATSEARCDDPDARAAERISTTGGGLTTSSPDAELCFTAQTLTGMEAGTVAVVDGERRVTVIAEPELMTNERLDEEGNAALLLRSLGRHETLVWLVPDPMGQAAVTIDVGELFGLGAQPAWMPVLLLQLVVLLGVAALWRGRRLGRIVSEPLPVTVRAAEAVAGRGRLYRRGRSFGHASAALRAGAAARTAGRLGLPRTADAATVIDAVANATGRPVEQVADLLYGPPPTDDAGLVQLARMLDQLESEVHRT